MSKKLTHRVPNNNTKRPDKIKTYTIYLRFMLKHLDEISLRIFLCMSRGRFKILVAVVFCLLIKSITNC